VDLANANICGADLSTVEDLTEEASTCTVFTTIRGPQAHPDRPGGLPRIFQHSRLLAGVLSHQIR
jgi:hypothetical protein